MLKKPIVLEKEKLLLVEGTHEEKFFQRVFKKENINNVQILNIVGKTRFREQLEILPKMDGFFNIKSIGLVRDADENFEGAFTSLVNALKNAGISHPQKAMEFTDSNPRVGIFITPDNQNSGSLEDLCLNSVQSDPVLSCANDYLECLKKIKNAEHPHKAKALVQVYLAKEDDGDIHMGSASERGVWDLENSSFLPIINFVKML